MVFRHSICAILLALALLCVSVYASPGGRMPQSSHGLSVSATASNAFGASLAAQTNGSMGVGESGRPLTSGIFWALPLDTRGVEVHITSSQWRNLAAGELPDSVITAVLADPQPLVSASEVMSMRSLKFTSVAVNALQPTEDGAGLRVCEQCDFDLSYVRDGQMPDSRKLSRSFYDLARGVAANLDDVVPAPELRPEAYLIITRPAYLGAALNSFVNWKRARGHTVYVATTDQTGTTNQQIKAYIQNAYNNLPEPPVFVTMVGDVDGTNPMPAWTVQGYYHPLNVTDHPYTLLDGTDWLPDVLIGRLSVDSGNEFQTVVNKCVNYESQPFQPNGTWRTKMLIAGVRSSPQFYQTYNSSWPTLRWIGQQMLASGYTQLDSVPDPPGNTSQISLSINNGVSFVAYRGFGEPGGWDFPSFNVSNVQSLTNGQKLPFVTSIVCGGGAFDGTPDPCFGEAWLRAGTPTNPAGAIGFIGPSELDTKTRWNNTNVAGIYEGILDEGVQTMSAAMLRGKLELIREFPNNIDNMQADPDRSVSFYFYCYNLLGDPGLTLFVGAVRDLTAVVPDTVAQGAPTLSLLVTENNNALPDAWGTVKLGDSVLSRAASDSTGHINLALPQSVTGQVQVTLTKPRHAPQQYTVQLVPQASNVASRDLQVIDNNTHGSSGNGDGITDAGERITFAVVLHNYGTGASDAGALSITSQDSAVQIVPATHPVPALAPGADSDTLFVSSDIARNCGDGQVGRITWSVTPAGTSWETTVDIHAPRLSIVSVNTDGANSNPDPHSTCRIALGIANLGRSVMPASNVVLRSLDSRLAVADSVVSYPQIAPGGTAQPLTQGFQITLGNFYPGDWAATELMANAALVTSPIAFPLPIGNLQGSDPTHPDTYGYRAFQSTDSGYAEAPVYAWSEIDPTLGGPGTVLSIPDLGEARDTTRIIPLPFSFRFYGVLYDHLSVCSNGFVSFGQTQESFFRNYSLPAIASPNNMVCAFWDDLFVPSTGHICTYHDTDGGRFIIEWSRVGNVFDGTEETFQILLYDTTCWRTRTGDGDVLVQYQTFNNVDTWDNYATVGIQDRNQGHALQVTYANHSSPGVSMIRSQQALLFTTGRPEGSAYFGYAGNVIDDDTTGGSLGNGDGIPQNGETVELAIRLQNTGGSPAPSQSGILRSSDPYLTRLDSAIIFPPVAPGDTAISNPLRIRISPSTPDAHVCNFVLGLSGDAVPCVMLPAMRVSGPLLSNLNPVMDDDSIAPSQGNGNHEFNPGEIVELTPGAQNVGANTARGVHAFLRYSGSRITILDSTATLGDIAPDSQRFAADALVLRVSPSAGDGEAFTVQIVERDSFGVEWSSSVNYMVMASNLSIAGFRLADPAPGGNGDSIFNLGEHGEIYPRVSNSGTGSGTGVALHFAVHDSLITMLDSVVTIGTISGNTTREASSPLHIAISDSGQEPRAVPFDVTISADGGLQIHSQLVVIMGNARLFDDFESNANYWSAYGSPPLWHLESREYHSATHAFYCGTEAQRLYPDHADSYLRSPSFNFPGRGTLIFSTRFDLADAGDLCRVQLQTGPSVYHLITSFSGSSEGWEERHVSLANLPAYENAQLRFWFQSNATGHAEGWYVDDVIIMASDLPVSEHPSLPAPVQFELDQNYPNPFNDQTTIQYSVPRTAQVRLSLYNLEGRKVATLVDAVRDAGRYRISYKPIALASGLYFVRLDAADIHLTTKIAYLK